MSAVSMFHRAVREDREGGRKGRLACYGHRQRLCATESLCLCCGERGSGRPTNAATDQCQLARRPSVVSMAELVQLELDEKDKENLQELQQSMGEAQRELANLTIKARTRAAEAKYAAARWHGLPLAARPLLTHRVSLADCPQACSPHLCGARAGRRGRACL